MREHVTMEKHRCNLCLKTFTNGRALGGHMRSHMFNLYLNPTPKPPPHSASPSPSPSPPSSSLSSSEVIKTEFSRTTSVRKRSKRVRRPESSWFADQQHFHEANRSDSSISDASPEEVVAYCLMMLSRDKWTHEEEEDVHDQSESDSGIEVVNVKRTPVRSNYRCETCDKSFRSYQALGGHIASHKKIKLNHQFHRNSNQQTINVSVEAKIHECHVCFKVFASGQALGGHKRSHVAAKHVVKQSIRLIDLNLPAPTDDDDDDDEDDDD